MPIPATTVLGSERRDAVVIDDITYLDTAGASAGAHPCIRTARSTRSSRQLPAPAVLAWPWFETVAFLRTRLGVA